MIPRSQFAMSRLVDNPIGNEAELTSAVLAAGRWVEAMGGGAVLKSKIMTIVSELGRNILKYAERGRVRCEIIERDAQRGLQVVAVDSGPGIADIDAALTDSYSTGGTLGLGLPGVRRMADDFELQSVLGKGTKVTVCIWIG